VEKYRTFLLAYRKFARDTLWTFRCYQRCYQALPICLAKLATLFFFHDHAYRELRVVSLISSSQIKLKRNSMRLFPVHITLDDMRYCMRLILA